MRLTIVTALLFYIATTPSAWRYASGLDASSRNTLPPGTEPNGSNRHPARLVEANADTTRKPRLFGFGRPATPKELAILDIAIAPDGRGLPAGSGKAATGRLIYAAKCASCHGKTGVEGPYPRLVGPMGDTTKAKTIGNYWPYATTIFDYTRRAMPYNAPGSLSNDEVYALTAFLLAVNKIIDTSAIINSKNLAKINMPAKKYFIPDDRKGGREVK